MKRILIRLVCFVLCLGLMVAFVSCNSEKPEEENSDIYYVQYSGVKIALGDKADGILKSLGDAKSVKELGDCGGLGAQIKYSYSDIDLYTLKTDSGETIDQISFTNDIASTSKNICLGADADAVISAYGEPTENNGSDMKYISGNKVLKFKLSDGIVTAIDYMIVSK